MDLVESGAVKPVIDSVFPLERGAEAMRKLETGHASGKVVVAVIAEKEATQEDAHA